eukprot:gb/GECH01009993.1/.p1 GENE.gb/GECH01009993.1/~~gb/GECH01009993.1/.p1  ORF type:complete len:312 (+),score=83.98 gb/GECH01009993.1/:1-936(+)
MLNPNNPSTALFTQQYQQHQQQQNFHSPHQHCNQPSFGLNYEQPIYDYYDQTNMFHGHDQTHGQNFGFNHVPNNQQPNMSSAFRKRKRTTPVDSSDSDSDLDEYPPPKRYLSESLARRLGKLNIDNRRYEHNVPQNVSKLDYYSDTYQPLNYNYNYHDYHHHHHYFTDITMVNDSNESSSLSSYSQQGDLGDAAMIANSKDLVPSNNHFNTNKQVDPSTDDEYVDLELNLSDIANRQGSRFPLYREVKTPMPNRELVPYNHPSKTTDSSPKPKSSVVIEELDPDAEDFMDFDDDDDGDDDADASVEEWEWW